jgi:hypothetical protein
MISPRAADDFTTIRARLEELRRERAPISSETESDSVIGPRPYGAEMEPEGHRLPRSVRQKLFGQ